MPKTKKGRPERISDALDATLLKVIKKGTPLQDKDGNIILDPKGKPIMSPPSAAFLNVARNRLRDLGITKVVTEGDSADELAAELGLKARPIPELSQEDDRATA